MIKPNKAVKDILINQLMVNGNKHKSETILLNNLKSIQKVSNKKLDEILKLSIVNSSPYFSIKKIQRKKKNPTEFPFLLKNSTRVLYGIKRLTLNSKFNKLNVELLDSAGYSGNSVSYKTELHKEAFLKKKMASYRWFC